MLEEKNQGYANIFRYLIAGMPKTAFAAILIVLACTVFKSFFTVGQHLFICIGMLLICGYELVLGAIRAIKHKRYLHRDVYLTFAIVGTLAIGMFYEAIFSAAVFIICRSVIATIYEWTEHIYAVATNQDVLLGGKKSSYEKNINNAINVFSAVSLIAIVIFTVVVPLIWRVPFISWLRRAFILFAAASPGAVAISSGIEFYKCLHAAYAKGIYFKSRESAIKFSKVTSLAFGKIELISTKKYDIDVIEPNNISKNELFMLAAYACSFSDNEIFETIVSESGIDVDITKVDMYKNIDGKGSAVMLGNVKLIAGNAAFINEFVKYDVELEDDEFSVFVAANGKYAGRIRVKTADAGSYSAAVQKLNDEDLDRVMLLTSDPASAAMVIAEKLGIDEVWADMNLEERLEKLNNLKQMQIDNELIAFVADSPSDRKLVEIADYGVSVGAAASVVDADVNIPNGDHTKIAEAFKLSKALVANIRRNLIISCIFKAVIIFFALLGIAGIWSVAILDTIAMVLVLKAKKNFRYLDKETAS